MKEIKLTRNFFLWCMSVIYLSAFSSLYTQIPGLYGDNGILPARSVIPIEAGANIMNQKTKEIPTLLWLAPALGIDVPLMMDFICLLGIIVSFGSMIWGRMRDMTNFTLLWMLYFSLFQVGQTFLWFQWDILLLELGFLAILVAPLSFLLQTSVRSGLFSTLPHRPHDVVSMWLVKWLLFRFMFSSGIVKLTSMCPTWWDLSALNYHFESQCIPTPLAWYAHHLPKWLLKLGVVGTFLIEIPIAFLFFSPIRSLRIFAFYAQVLFQISIILTGNYNFFNILTIVMCFSLVDDDFLLNLVGRPTSASKPTSGTALRWIKFIITFLIENVVIIGLLYGSVKFFSLKFFPDWSVESNIAFSAGQFRNLLSEVMPFTVTVGALSLSIKILIAFYRSLVEPGIFKKLHSLIGTIFVSGAAVWLFTISLVPHSALDVKMRNNLWPVVQQWHKRVDEFHISNAYGLFRKMTGVGGRPELILEGSNSLSAGWKEYHFLYKPGDLSQKPPFLIPHQPRLDWQMWFAALGSYEHNPWFVSFVYRLLDGEKDVNNLLDKDRLPFPVNKPPKYIRAILYNYSYTKYTSADSSVGKRETNDWWTRHRVREYFNSANLDDKQATEFLAAAGIPMEKTRFLRVTNAFLKKSLIQIRSYISTLQPTTFIWSLLAAGFSINFLAPILRL